MKKFHSRLTAIVLSTALLVTVLPSGVSAQEPESLSAEEATCTCTVPCTEESMNPECTVCAAEGAAPEDCAALVVPSGNIVSDAGNAGDTDDAGDEENEPVLLGVQDSVAYVDGTGAAQTHDGVTEVTSSDTTWESGWYVADGTISMDHRVTVEGAVTLILADGCDLTVDGGIDVSAGNRFTVYGQAGGSGSLSAVGATYDGSSGDAGIGGNADTVDFGDITLAATGTITATGGYRAAGIGGGGKVNNLVLTTGNITICSGTVTGKGNGGLAAGIGNGTDGSGNDGTIRITGGTVTGDGYAAIGAGYNGYAGNIEISGGTVFAEGNGVIGANPQGRGGMDGQFSTGEDGNAVIFADSIQDQDQKADWSGVIFQGKTGQVYGTSVTPVEDFTILPGYTLTIPGDAALQIESGITATNDGTIENCGIISGDIQGTPANTRLALEILDETGTDVEGKISYGQTITLRVFGPNLPQEGDVDFTCNGTSLGNASIQDGAAVLKIALPETAGGNWPIGSYTFEAEASGITGEQTAELRYLIVPPEPQATEVTSTSITLQTVSYPDRDPAPTVQYGYVRADETDGSISWTGNPSLTNLDCETDYIVFVRIQGDGTYHEMCSDGVLISTKPGLNAFPAGGLDLANGSVEIEAGQSGNLIVTQGTDLYDVDEDTIIPVTGDGTASNAQIILQSDTTAHVLLSYAHMESADYAAPIEVRENASLFLILDGENSLCFSDSYARAGISMMWGSSLEIDGNGALTIGTPDAAPRVGIGPDLDGFRQITILGGKVTVYGRYAGVGVEDMWYGGEEKPGVIIRGGSLYAEIVGDSSRGAAIGGKPMFDEMEAPCTVQIDGGSVVAGNGGICGDVQITGGNVTGTVEGLTDARYPAKITAPSGATVQALVLRDASGTAVEYGCPDTVPDTGELTLYLPAGTYSGTMLVDGQLKTFSGLTVPGDSQSAVSLTDTGVQADLPDGTELPLETDGADVVLPAGSTVQAGSGPVMTLPAGGTVSESGTVAGPVVQMGNTTMTAPEGEKIVMAPDGTAELPAGSTVHTGDGPAITVNGQGATVNPAGEVTLPGGGSATVTDEQGNTTQVTLPAAGGTLTPDGYGTVTLPVGSTVQTGAGLAITVSGQGATVNPKGEVTIPGGGSATVADKQGHTMTVTMPESGGTLAPSGDGSVTLPAGSTVQTGNQTITIPEEGGAVRPDGSVEYLVTVTFDSQGGSTVERVRLAAGTKLTAPAQPTRTGYRFTGWYQDAACTTVWDFDTMPVTADLTLYAGWSIIPTGGSSGSSGSSGNSGTVAPDEQKPQSNPFTDVPENAYYSDAVQWAVENGITTGFTETSFGPNRSCTRAQMVTFLWRAAGSPAPASTNHVFQDVPEGAYYADAVLWAAEQGITGGTSAETFSPNATVTRAQTVTFLYRAAGSPAGADSGFADVAADAYYADAVAWAAAQGITSGTTAETFSPSQACTRAQIVTFLYRDRA